MYRRQHNLDKVVGGHPIDSEGRIFDPCGPTALKSLFSNCFFILFFVTKQLFDKVVMVIMVIMVKWQGNGDKRRRKNIILWVGQTCCSI
jgi:hypothetical protein